MYQFTSSWNRSTKSNLSTNFSLVLWTLSSSFFHYIIFIHFTQGHCSSLGYCHHFLWLVFLRCSTSGICILCYLTIWKIILWPVKIRFLFFSPPPPVFDCLSRNWILYWLLIISYLQNETKLWVYSTVQLNRQWCHLSTYITV